MQKVLALLYLVLQIGFLTLQHVNGDPLVPCYYIFGDSLSDAGNNNDLITKAVANYFPYGMDFALVDGHPSGRFTNGQTLVDVLAGLLKFQTFIAPFSTANDQQLIQGVNYASGSAGIRSETGQHLGDRISLGEQVQNHKQVISRVAYLLNASTSAHLQSCLYTMYIGSNDYLNNYFLTDHYSTFRKFNLTQFTDQLLSQYSTQIKTLYKSGARKIALIGLGKIGCALAEIARFRPKGVCVESMNVAANRFNQRLEALVKKLNKQLPGSKFVFINPQAIQVGPQQGITVLDKPCCTLREEDFQCQKGYNVCNERSKYFFWDGFHSTEAANRVIGEAVFKSLKSLI